MKIIFLDFDGVIVTRHTNYQKGHKPCLDALQYIIDHTGADIVISSTWRHFGLKECIQYLRSWGLQNFPVRGMTGEFRASRGEEIQDFITEYGDMGIEIDKFVILDDDNDMNGLEPFLIRTNVEEGLTMAHAIHAIRRLNDEG